MILKEITLRNFKSHRNTKISFEKGINLIVGRNGAGKSSVLEAILVALYGVRQGSTRKSDLVQVGANEYTIELFFEYGGREYRISRASNGDSVLYGDLRIEGDQKINEWIEKNVSPFHIFTGAVYVRQGEIETIISDESGREKIIRKITRIEDYENAWKNLGSVIKEFENEMKRYLEIVKQKEECEKRLGEKNSEILEVEKEIKNSEKNLEGAKESIEKISKERSVFEELKKQIDAKNLELLKLEGEIKSLKERSEVLGKQKSEIEQKIVSLQESLKKLEFIERKAKKYSELFEFHRNFLKDLQDLDSKLKDLEIEKERISSELKKCEEEKENIEKIRREIEEIEREKENLASKAEKWQKIKPKIDRKVQIEKIFAEKGLTAEKVEKMFLSVQKAKEVDKALKEELEKISTQKGSLISEEKRFLEIMSKLKSTVGICPICGRELTEEHKRKLIDNCSLEITRIKSEFSKIDEKERKLREESRKVEVTLEKQELVLKYKQLVDELKKISEDLKDLDLEKMKLESEKFERLKNKIDFLRDSEKRSLEKLQKLEILTEKFTEIEAKHSKVQKSKEELFNQLKDKNFSSIEDLEKELSELKESYEEWLGLRRAKEEFEDAESNLKTLKDEFEKVLNALMVKEREYNEKKKIMADLEGRYDEKRHREVEKIEKELSMEIAGMKQKISVLRKSLESLKGDKEYLEKQLEVIKESEKKAKAIERAIPELIKIREKFASYKNIVAEFALKEVEKYASEIFEEFTEGKYSGIKLKRVFEYGKERLRIFVIHQGEERETSFLSGGELVALGIAFRLALSMFEAKGRIPLLIMDEPTPFLDEERRRKLVDITLNYLRRIPQVIIVSHDEELKDAADKVILVDYRGGVSVVASQ
ncbi:MAG: DNA double-strand break repair ATPase Rad50 [Archaeoglobaceae archaeon]